MNLEAELRKHFSFNSFRGNQKEVISSLLAGRHTLAMLATGTGKSLCYQLPAYILKKPVVILSPLVSLMQDQVEQLKLHGEKRVIAINSFLDRKEKERALAHIRDYLFIFLSPEMISSDVVIQALRKLDIGLLAIDEAHCISQWGHDFRPSYMQIGKAREILGNPLTLALTATATEEVRREIKVSLRLDNCYEVVSSVDRPNIGIFIEESSTYKEKKKRMLELCRQLKNPGIVYFSSKKQAEEACEEMNKAGIYNAGLYHADLEQEQRILIQQQFLNGQLNIICATSAFGMGINKENVRFIIHFHLPQNMETYLQEIGRAGRDGKNSAAILLYTKGDEGLPLFLMEHELPQVPQLSALHHFFLAQSDAPAEEELSVRLRSLGFTETQERVFRHYFSTSVRTRPEERVEDVKMAIEEVKRRKQQRWRKFHEWFTNPACLREGIRSYYDETLSESKGHVCCSNCGDSLNGYLRGADADTSFPGESSMGWKAELKMFLKPERLAAHE